MGNDGARAFGLDEAPGDPNESVKGQIKLLDAATRETHGGKFYTWEGENIPF